MANSTRNFFDKKYFGDSSTEAERTPSQIAITTGGAPMPPPLTTRGDAADKMILSPEQVRYGTGKPRRVIIRARLTRG